MKRIVLWIILGILTSCEDVIDVDLNKSAPRLVIEATINLLEDGTATSIVKLSTSAPFFENQVPIVEDASVKITDEIGNIFNFVYVSEGKYESNLIPQLGLNYSLEVIYEDEVYTATEQLYEGSSLEYVEQRNDGGFTGEEVELKAFFTDPAGIENYYFFEGLSERGDHLDAYDDEFFDGNTIFGLYLADDLTSGDEVVFNLYGVNNQFYSFMYVLLQQTGSGGPFETQPATVRGNIINETNRDNFPLGYFRISEISTLTYIVQ